jgi:signal transduction histidine kinase
MAVFFATTGKENFAASFGITHLSALIQKPKYACLIRNPLYLILCTFLLSIPSNAQLAVKQVLINGHNYSYTPNSPVSLSTADDNLVIELNPLAIDSVKYYYRLSGLQKNWFWTSYPAVHYQQLAGGNYRFQIKAEKSNYATRILEISIEKKQAFWQKWWFWPSIVLYVFLIFGIGFYLFFIYDLRQKLKIQDVRNQIASDLHDEVGSNLNSIAIFVELLRKKVIIEKPDLLPILDKITDNSEETVMLMRDTVWAINPENDSTEKLFERMRSFGLEILSAKGISFDFESSVDMRKDVFSMEQRRNLYLIYKEAINNISKHSFATSASCKIYHHQGLIRIEIIDNGTGFDFSRTFEGNGLKNFKLRSQENDLKVNVNSNLQKGTEVLVEIAI